jgi:mRNA interferase RelE/StbE
VKQIYALKTMAEGWRSLRAVRDKKARREIAKAIDGLAESPDLQGKPLDRELTGYRAIRAFGDKYRILYKVDEMTVFIVWIGERKPGQEDDVYAKARKLYKTFLS